MYVQAIFPENVAPSGLKIMNLHLHVYTHLCIDWEDNLLLALTLYAKKCSLICNNSLRNFDQPTRQWW